MWYCHILKNAVVVSAYNCLCYSKKGFSYRRRRRRLTRREGGGGKEEERGEEKERKRGEGGK